MLTIKCSKCKAKLIKYKKIGPGKVIKCWMDRIARVYQGKFYDDSLVCSNCKNTIGKVHLANSREYIKMHSAQFTYSGQKD